MKLYRNLSILAICITSVFLVHYEISNSSTPKNPSLQKSFPKKRKHTYPSTFGKTHFIVGFDHQEYKQNTKQQSDENLAFLHSADGQIKRALFSPDDNIRQTLINLIEHEQQAIKIAIFSFTDQGVADTLINAARNGIHVELITDPYTLHTPFSKITYLKKYRIQIYVYKPQDRTAISDRMHDKFIVFSKNINDKPLLWTGSFNFTRAADKSNQENVVVLEDRTLIEQFDKQFNRLKRRSKPPTS